MALVTLLETDAAILLDTVALLDADAAALLDTIVLLDADIAALLDTVALLDADIAALLDTVALLDADAAVLLAPEWMDDEELVDTEPVEEETEVDDETSPEDDEITTCGTSSSPHPAPKARADTKASPANTRTAYCMNELLFLSLRQHDLQRTSPDPSPKGCIQGSRQVKQIVWHADGDGMKNTPDALAKQSGIGRRACQSRIKFLPIYFFPERWNFRALLSVFITREEEDTMPRRKTIFTQNGLYHVYNHGARQTNILTGDVDFRGLYSILHYYARKLGIEVPVWCFMPNHYHWLVVQHGEIPVSKLPYHVFNVYSRCFNRIHDERGTLFESRFKVKPVTTPEYLAQLCLYIHANPVKAGLCDTPQDWPWSNIGECLLFPLHPVIASVFPNQKEYKKQLLHYCKNGMHDPADLSLAG